MRILCNAKDSHILSTTNNSVFAYVVGMYLKRVEVLTMTLKLTGPRCFFLFTSDFNQIASVVVLTTLLQDKLRWLNVAPQNLGCISKV